MVGHVVADPPQASLIVDGLGKGFGLPKVLGELLGFTKYLEHMTQLESEIDRPLTRVTPFWQMLECCQRLLEVPYGFAVRRPCHGPCPCLARVGVGFVPHLTPKGMMCQFLDLLNQLITAECVQNLDNLRMEGPSPFLEQTTVCNLMCQGVFEGIDAFGEQAGFVEEFRCLEMRETLIEGRFRQLGNGVK
jgi:hypothetical protein